MVYGLTQIIGEITMNDIVKTLELMCDKNNPQDKKLLLLAELVETKCEALGENQEELKSKISETNQKLDRLTNILEKYEDDKNSCPVYKNKDEFEQMIMLMKYPKITLFVILGILAVILGVVSSSASDFIKYLVGA